MGERSERKGHSSAGRSEATGRRFGLRLRALAFIASLAVALGTVAAPGTQAAPSRPAYYTGDFKISLNLYSFNLNLRSWLTGRESPPPIDTLEAIRFAKQAGFDAVDVTAYYIPGWHFYEMPTKPREEVMAYARQIRELSAELDIAISGTGASNDFASADPARRALDLQRVKFWIDVAAEMGAPVMRVFSGNVPADIDQLGWEAVSRQRIVPALRELADYGAARGVEIGLQNHGDMTATADQTIQLLRWVDHGNIGIIDDTGYFRPFRSETGLGYDWYGDIAQVLPYTNNFQLKKKPAGAETDIPMDLDRVFTDLRLSDYRGYVPVELLWVRGEPGYPRDLPEPPFDQVEDFLAKVKASMHATRTQPFHAVRVELTRYLLSGAVRLPAYLRLNVGNWQAETRWRSGRPEPAMRSMQDFLRDVDRAAARGEVNATAAAALTARMTALHDAFTDTYR
jgi:sugar phosphate isomerase/epimerase